MRTQIAPLLAALASSAALIAAGCQADPEPGFTEEADEMCEEQYADSANALAIVGFVAGPREAAGAREELAEAAREATRSLAALAPPAEHAKRFARFIAARRAGQATRARELAAEMGLSVCAQELDSEQIDAVEETLDDAFTEAEPACTKLYTGRFLLTAFGSEEECALAPEADLPDEVELGDVRGSEGEVAVAEVTLEGGRLDGRRLTATLLYQRSDPVITDLVGLDVSRPLPPAGS